MSTESESPLFLPFELLTQIIELLPTIDKQAFSLVSRFARGVALPNLFPHIVIENYDSEISSRLLEIIEFGKDVKETIRILRIHVLDQYPAANESEVERSLFFLVLGTLPNLHSLIHHQDGPFISPSKFHELFLTIRNVPLTEFIIKTSHIPGNSSPSFVGLSGLQKLSIIWGVYDHPANPGSSLAQLHKLIHPTLSTLVSPKIKDISESNRSVSGLDLRNLKVAGKTLRVFSYKCERDDGILDTIPEAFPLLTSLVIR